MPKFSHRCNRRSGHHAPFQSPVAPVAFSAPPRKVSFEDGHSDSDSSLSGSGSSSSEHRQIHRVSDPTPLRPKAAISTLRRPKSSLSLVELAKDDVENDVHQRNDNKLQQPQQPHGQSSDEHATTTSNMLASPVSTPLDMQVSSSLPLPSSPSSPWGYFVDMVMPLDDNDAGGVDATTAPSPPHLISYHHEGPCSCCTSCRRRRASPYGDYKKQKQQQQQQRRSSLCFSATTEQHRRSIPLPLSIRLAPRRREEQQPLLLQQHRTVQSQEEPADQLAGALTHLHVMDS